ncbi:transglycosylase domain-containing protein [Dactylosporangium matsuzakiense]|uniref:Penicillin-binding protein n=1 Tax=Dactylosporangium matsuzakiense TaxID=53360 RepID=A0A9W6NSD6_9ACTN|nr:transglycosylase domain-containing protein [Dactylosporangium matsuzakiense]GLL08245.1 penicillin-binding protein [Dactylosporangium matsuzakiense]
MRKREHGLLPNAASLLLCGLLAGLVVAAAAFPAVAMSGLAAKAGSDTFESLPTDIDVLPSPQISYVYASDGKTLLATMYDENRRDVKIEDVAEVMQKAMVAAEDNRFYQHRGVDVKGVARAFVANQNAGGQTEQGASTLTMQYVRQAIAYSAKTPQEVVDATDKTPTRKLREMKYAIDLEKKLSKKEILERYLNIAPFGHGAYGVYAAAHVYFDKDPKDLTLAESALLAGLVKAPGTNDPATAEGLPRALDRQKYVLNQMVGMLYVDQATADAAGKEKLTIVGKRTPEGCESIQRPELGAGFYCDYLRRWWNQQKVFGEDEFQRANRLRAGGYTVIASLDIATQTAAFKYAKEQPFVSKDQQVRMGSQNAMMLASVQPGTGRVLALATNRNFSNDQTQNGANTNPDKKGQKGNYPNTTVPIITGDTDIPGYQAGSAFKMFTAVAALESGLPLATTINTEKQFVSDFIIGPGPATCNGNHYCPKNSGGQSGPYNMWTGFGSSINTFFVPLEQQVGVDHVVDVAKRLGIQFNAKEDAALAANPKGWGAFTLGVSATTPLQLANAYGTLAADGVYCEPSPINEVKDNSGKKVEGLDPKCKQAVDPEVARAAVDMARCPVGDQSATGKCAGATAQYARDFVKRPIAGKTGTTDSEKSATFTVMTKQMAVSGFLTDPDWPETNKDMKHPPVNYAALGVLRDGLAGQPVVQFTAPTKDRAQGKLVDIPSVKCLSVDQARAKVKQAGFSVSVASGQVASQCPPGTVDRTSPAGSTTKGGAVQLVVSKGPGAPAPPYVGGDGDNGNGGRGHNDVFPNGDVPDDNGNGGCPIPWVC